MDPKCPARKLGPLELATLTGGFFILCYTTRMPVVFTKRVVLTPPSVREAYWRGAPYLGLLDETRRDMGDQARVNVVRFGEPGGSWQHLQGFNANTNQSRRINQLRARVASGGVGGVVARRKLAAAQREQARSARARAERKQVNATIKQVEGRKDAGSWTRQRQLSKLRMRSLVLPHAGYARRKAAGKTPGHGKFGPDVRLRDTGSLFAGLDGDLKFTPTGALISLVSRGRNAGRPANQQLLEFHALGMGHNPVRNPAQDMTLFQARAQKRWRTFLSNAPGVRKK